MTSPGTNAHCPPPEYLYTILRERGPLGLTKPARGDPHGGALEIDRAAFHGVSAPAAHHLVGGGERRGADGSGPN